MAALDALEKRRYPLGRRHTRNRTSYGSMHNWLHSELSGHALSTYRDPESHLIARGSEPPAVEGSRRFVLATQRGCQTVTEEEPAEGAAAQPPRLTSSVRIMRDYPMYQELRESMTERDRNRHGVNYRSEDLEGRQAWTKLPILPSPRPHDQNPPVHLQYGPESAGYDDAHKAYLKQSKAAGGIYEQPKLRNGKGGSTWRHIKFPLQPDGSRIQFLDGQVSVSDAYRRQLALQPELGEQHQLQQLRAAEASERYRRQVHETSRRPTAQRGMEYNNWRVMR